MNQGRHFLVYIVHNDRCEQSRSHGQKQQTKSYGLAVLGKFYSGEYPSSNIT